MKKERDFVTIILVILSALLIGIPILLAIRDAGAAAGGKGATWDRSPTVVDTLSDDWGNELKQQVELFNDIAPFPIRYYDCGPTCDTSQFGKGYIVVEEDTIFAFGITSTPGMKGDRIIIRSNITVLPYDTQVAYGGEDFAINTLCHELMHALAWVNEVNGKDSCVSNNTQKEPGSWDKKFLRKTHRKYT